MNNKSKALLLTIATTFLLIVLLVQGMALAKEQAAATASASSSVAKGDAAATSLNEAVAQPEGPSAEAPAEAALAKIHPDLREVAQSGTPALPADSEYTVEARADAQQPLMIQVIARSDDSVQVADFFVDGKVIERPPLTLGDHTLRFYVGQANATNLLKIAAVDDVTYVLPVVLEQNARPDDYPIDEERSIPERTMEDWEALREEADQLRAQAPDWQEAKAFGDGRPGSLAPQDWYEVMPEGPHKAQTAWNRGYTGQGVSVAVLDDGVDFAHPDLMGTQKIYSSTMAKEYNGWPMAFSPISMLLYANDVILGTTYIADGYPGAHYVDTSATPPVSGCGVDISCFNYTPLIDYGVSNPFAPPSGYTYVIDNSMTQSGVIHVGTHPDNDIRDFVLGEKPAVLVTDPNTAFEYDTVYVDLDGDRDFRDEKPLTKADVNNLSDPANYNSMVAYRDLTADGLADISGGALYFIADGTTEVPVSDWLWGLPAPANGDLVAFTGGTFDRPYSHGTQCASNIVGQGVTTGFLQPFDDLTSPDGKPDAAVYGMAPDAKIVTVADIYYNFASSKLDGYLFSALGYDGTGHSDDDPLITSNSYGSSDVDNDGWELDGQFVSQIQRYLAHHTQFMFSTGNGAPAYGTVAPPSPDTAIGVGASTEYGSTGWDSITNTQQIMNNDVTPFSNRGPGARGTAGTSVVAGGAFAAGAQELNYYTPATWGVYDGNLAWSSWGGTSRSAPVAAGVLALIYDAYHEANGVYPTYDTARALLMSSATDINYDVFSQGAGSVNADRGTAVAGGHYGVYAVGDDAQWTPGDYRGTDYPGFAHLVYPGSTYTKSFTILNPGGSSVTVNVDDAEMKLINSVEFTYSVTEDMVDDESVYGSSNRDNFFKAFNYLIPITATAGADNSMHSIDVPADADLMIVRQTFDYDQFDVDGDYAWDNRFYLNVYNWEDVDGDGLVWDDSGAEAGHGNGVVNFINDPTTFGQQADGAIELDWDDPRTELDRWEFGRFSYHRPGGNRNEMWVHDPLDRMLDGLFIGLRHHPGSSYEGQTDLNFRVEFYREEDIPWLSLSDASLTIPSGSTETFMATVNVPNDIPTGMYQAAIQIADPGMAPDYEANTTVIPVAMNVAEEFTPGMQLGGYDTYTYDQDRPYNNAAVRGLFDWTWRAESGDWRFFSVDITDTYSADTSLLVKDEWDDAAPHTDIDTIVLGPTTTPTITREQGITIPEPGYFGPYVLDTVAKSPNTNAGGGTWIFDTSSGANEDWIATPLEDGLHGFLQHNVLFEGDKTDVVFTKTLGTLEASPDALSLRTFADSGEVGAVTLESSLPLNGVVASAVGPYGPVSITNEPIDFVSSNTIEWTHVFTTSNALFIDAFTSSPDISDIDLYLFYCGPSGTSCSVRASSTTPTANEAVHVDQPQDGYWLIGINNWSGPAGHFNLTYTVAQGDGFSVSGLPAGSVAANTPVSFTVDFDYPLQTGVTYQGLLAYGIPEAPGLQQIPITIEKVDAIEKTVDKSFAFPGEQLQYTLWLDNPQDPAPVEVVDPLPPGTEFVSATAGSYNGTTNEFVFQGTLTGTMTIDLVLSVTQQITPGITITNTATMTAPDLFGGAHSGSAITDIATDASFAPSFKEASASASPGELIEYTLHAVNSGETLAENVVMTDTIPAGTTFDSLESLPPTHHFVYDSVNDEVEWIGDVGPGQEVEVTFWVTVDADTDWFDVIDNSAYLTYDGQTSMMQASTTVVPPVRVYMPFISRN